MDGKLYRNLELLGFTIIGNIKPYFFDRPNYKLDEVNNDLFLRIEIERLIIEDLIEAIENDLEEGDNYNPIKWVREMVKEGLL